jgi:pimeloyl-ACP methyl ester carboxylesterase
LALVIPGFISNIETYWEWPEFAGWLHQIGTRARVIIFDKRGTGLSDRLGQLPNLDQRMDDARAVMDAAGSKRAAIMGLSEGGSLATLFAGTHPERCSALVLWGAFAHLTDWLQKFDAFVRYVDTSWQRHQLRIFRPVQERQHRLSALVGPMGKAGRQPVGGAKPDANE